MLGGTHLLTEAVWEVWMCLWDILVFFGEAQVRTFQSLVSSEHVDCNIVALRIGLGKVIHSKVQILTFSQL